jgi:hypothetical protein
MFTSWNNTNEVGEMTHLDFCKENHLTDPIDIRCSAKGVCLDCAGNGKDCDDINEVGWDDAMDCIACCDEGQIPVMDDTWWKLSKRELTDAEVDAIINEVKNSN